MNERQEALLNEWLGRLRKAQKIHYRRVTFFRWWFLIIGIPIVALSTLSGFLAFGLPIVPLKDAGIWAGIVSIVVAILASVQTFLRLDERAEAHFKAAKAYSNIKNEIEEKLALSLTEEELREFVPEFRRRWESVNNEAPEAPRRYWDGDNM